VADIPNCYACRYRRPIAGDMHSSCAHPTLTGDMSAQGAAASSVLTTGGAAVGGNALPVSGDPGAIARGFFVWPVNFDPVWLRACSGFTPL
jgi:hypothetical protein